MIKNTRPWLVSLRKAMRGILAILSGLVVIHFLSIGTNYLVRNLGVFPYGDPGAALVYRSIYVVLGGYITSRLASFSPMQHALVLGGIHSALFIGSAIILIPMQFFGPTWYHYGLAITSLPCAWLGGILHRKSHQ
jgi:hypothetical protein